MALAFDVFKSLLKTVCLNSAAGFQTFVVDVPSLAMLVPNRSVKKSPENCIAYNEYTIR